MAAPDMRAYLETLVGKTLPTITGKPNTVLEVTNTHVFVATDDNPAGAGIQISLLQGVVDAVYAGEEVVLDPRRRSAFVAAVLSTMDSVEVLPRPRRARLVSTAASQQNPAWQFDELILALDLYLRWRPRQPPAGHPDLVALSELLQALPLHPLETRGPAFRSPLSVRRKLGDFTDPDPTRANRPTKGGAGVHEVWSRFADDPAGLETALTAIADVADGVEALSPEEDEAEAVEGRILFRRHRVRERDAALVGRKKTAVLHQLGRLACEVCGIDFAERYGPLGEGFIECHHTVALASAQKRITRMSDLALVCPNCHRMIHRARPPLTVEQLRALLRPS